jgi:hypothetical protein
MLLGSGFNGVAPLASCPTAPVLARWHLSATSFQAELTGLNSQATSQVKLNVVMTDSQLASQAPAWGPKPPHIPRYSRAAEAGEQCFCHCESPLVENAIGFWPFGKTV